MCVRLLNTSFEASENERKHQRSVRVSVQGGLFLKRPETFRAYFGSVLQFNFYLRDADALRHKLRNPLVFFWH